MSGLNQPEEEVENDKIGIFRAFLHAWPLSIPPIVIISLLAAGDWFTVVRYIQNYQKHLKGTVETLLSYEEPCAQTISVPSDKPQPLSCRKEYHISTTGSQVIEQVRDRIDYQGFLNTDYTPFSEPMNYTLGNRPWGELTSSFEYKKVTTYTQQWDFLGIPAIPRYAPYVHSEYAPTTQSFTLTNSNDTRFKQAKQYTLTPENLPTDQDIRDLATLLQSSLHDDSDIQIVWHASAEWQKPEDLVSHNSDSFFKNRDLAQKRAEYVQRKLIEYAPELQWKIHQVFWMVNVLTNQDIEDLQPLLQRLWMDKNLSWIHTLIHKYESWASLEEMWFQGDDQKLIQRIFQRNTQIAHTFQESKTDKTNGFDGSTDLTLSALVFIHILAILGIGPYTYLVYNQGKDNIRKKWSK